MQIHVCMRQVGGDVTNISASILDGVFNITPAIEEYTIATSPAIIEFYVPVQISPGERISLNITSRDDLKQRSRAKIYQALPPNF